MAGIFKVNKDLASRPDFDKVFNFVEDSYFSTAVAYLIHSNYRQAVALTPWIKDQVTNPDDKVLEFYKTIGVNDSDSNDRKVITILGKVITWLKYTSDQTDWNMPEYWQTALESVSLQKGDCEDGAILIYVLCRLAGVPADRLFITAGDVNGGGHCWCAYRPQEFPINFVFLDWCYWPTAMDIPNRPFFDIEQKAITEYGCYDSEGTQWYQRSPSNYYDIWFSFNEDTSYLSFMRR